MEVSAHDRIADGAALTAWIGYFFSHLTAANEVLQFIVLCIALVSGTYALLFHRKRLKAME
jgi:hypothetical protein